MEDDVDFDLGTRMTVITIVFHEELPPQIELGGVNPLIASSIFRIAADTLEGMMIGPTILNHGQVMSSEEIYFVELDEDDDL